MWNVIWKNMSYAGNNSYMRKWKPVEVTKMKNLLRLSLLRGSIKKPDITMYWVKIELLESPAFSTIILHDSFRLILQFLHFNDNNDPNYYPNAED